MVLAHEKLFRNQLKAEVFFEVFINVFNYFIDVLIEGNIFADRFGKIIKESLINHYNIFREVYIPKHRASEALASAGFLEFLENRENFLEFIGLEAQQVIITRPMIFKTQGEVGAALALPLKIIRIHPQHNSLVRLPGFNYRPVNILVVYYQNITRAQLIGAAFNYIGDLAGKVEKNLVKIMFMILHIYSKFVFTMEVFEVRGYHILP